MGLKDLKTDLKSLKYDKDTIEGGESPYLKKFNKLPWVKNPIPEGFEGVGGKGSLDQLYRGGGQGGVTEATLRDTRRISNFLQSNTGLEFLAKQAGLMVRQNIELYGLNPVNWKFVYNPASSLVNTTLAPTGKHLTNIITLKGASGVNSGPGYLYGQPNANIPRESNDILGENKTFFSKKDKIFIRWNTLFVENKFAKFDELANSFQNPKSLLNIVATEGTVGKISESQSKSQEAATEATESGKESMAAKSAAESGGAK